jgi:hypothetical protein
MVEGGGNSTHSFADGRFVLENFRGDEVTIRFTHPDFTPTAMEAVRDGATGLVVRMERPRPTLVLDVRDRDTLAPLNRVRVEFWFAAGTAQPAPTSPERLGTDGRHKVKVPDGATTLTVSASGHEPEAVVLAGPTDGEYLRVLLAPTSAK